MTPGPTLPSRLLGWLEDGRRTIEFTRRKLLEDRRERLLMPFITSPIADVLGLLRAAGVRDAVLVLRDKVAAEGVVADSWSLKGRSDASSSSRDLDARGTKSSEEPRRLELVVIGSGSAHSSGEPFWDSGESGELVMGQPQTATAWACRLILVCTLLGRERRARVDSDAMVSAADGCRSAGSTMAEGIAPRARENESEN
jgi:hypothetical protein